MHPELLNLTASIAEAHRLNNEAIGRELARIADAGPEAYLAEMAEESSRQAAEEEFAPHS